MLKKLKIQNIILIQSATLEFASGFHIFSGETGAGKTAILQALSLILGSRLDPQILRRGETEASVEAHFDLSKTSSVYPLIKEANLEIDPSEDLVIKREIRSTGKSKILINCQWAPLHLLKKIAPYLIEIVSQHGTQKLFDLQMHRSLLDRFGTHLKLSQSVSELFTSLRTLKEQVLKLEEEEKEALKLHERYFSDLEEIELAKITSENEEEEVFQEYQNISQSKERYQALSEITHSLQEADPSLLSALGHHVTLLSKYSPSDPKLFKMEETLRGTTEELRELSFSLLNYRDSIVDDPERLAYLEERLKILNHLKKRYGPSLKEVLKNQADLSQKISSHQDLSKEKEKLQLEVIQKERAYEDLAETLTQMRIKAKDALELKTNELFKHLNLADAKFVVELKEAYPSEFGNESVEFFLKANLGEKKTSLREKVSGGELSRVLLSLKVLLSELEETPTLIFDEIDTNLGGETAPKIGKLLKKVSTSKQVIAITHLPQVAIFGKHHFLIHKKQEKSRTYSLIEKLSEKQKVCEIERMLGGKGLSQKAQDLAKDLLQSS